MLVPETRVALLVTVLPDARQAAVLSHQKLLLTIVNFLPAGHKSRLVRAVEYHISLLAVVGLRRRDERCTSCCIINHRLSSGLEIKLFTWESAASACILLGIE